MIATQVFDTARGSMAAVTARIVDGVMIYSKRIYKNPSKTVKQIFQRDKQQFVRRFVDSVKISIVDSYWPKVRPLVAGYSNCIGKNLLAQTEYVAPETPFVADKLKLKTSDGSLEGLIFEAPNTYVTATGAFECTWATDIFSTGEATDTVILVVYQMGEFYPNVLTNKTRTDGSYTGFIAVGLDLADLVFLLFATRVENDKQLRSPTVASAVVAP